MSNVTIRTCVLGVDAYYCKDMFRIRADILESREGGAFVFQNIPETNLIRKLTHGTFLISLEQ